MDEEPRVIHATEKLCLLFKAKIKRCVFMTCLDKPMLGGTVYVGAVSSLRQRVYWADDLINAPPPLLLNHINQENDWATATPVQFERKCMSKDDDKFRGNGEDTMNAQLDRIEFKLDQILACMMKNVAAVESHADAPKQVEHDDLHKFTPKQHAALQMLLNGATNQDIADRMKVGLNTAKVHVRGIAKKLGVNSRTQIILRMQAQYEAVDEGQYRLMTGGLPKDWDENFDDDVECEYRSLYEKAEL